MLARVRPIHRAIQRRAHFADGPPRRNARTSIWLPPAGVLAPPDLCGRRV